MFVCSSILREKCEYRVTTYEGHFKGNAIGVIFKARVSQIFRYTQHTLINSKPLGLSGHIQPNQLNVFLFFFVKGTRNIRTRLGEGIWWMWKNSNFFLFQKRGHNYSRLMRKGAVMQQGQGMKICVWATFETFFFSFFSKLSL